MSTRIKEKVMTKIIIRKKKRRKETEGRELSSSKIYSRVEEG